MKRKRAARQWKGVKRSAGGKNKADRAGQRKELRELHGKGKSL